MMRQRVLVTAHLSSSLALAHPLWFPFWEFPFWYFTFFQNL
jgi:hypothetical protein